MRMSRADSNRVSNAGKQHKHQHATEWRVCMVDRFSNDGSHVNEKPVSSDFISITDTLDARYSDLFHLSGIFWRFIGKDKGLRPAILPTYLPQG